LSGRRTVAAELAIPKPADDLMNASLHFVQDEIAGRAKFGNRPLLDRFSGMGHDREVDEPGEIRYHAL